MVIAIVLAAGQGARLGGPKALLLVRPPVSPREMPLIEAQCVELLGSGSARALAVVRPDVAALTGEGLRAAGAEVVVSRALDALGPAGSLAAAAACLLPGGAPPVARAGGSPPSTTPGRGGRAERDRGWASSDTIFLVTPVDVRAGAGTAGRLAAALLAPSGDPSALVAVPRHSGRRGHPVALRAEALARYLEPDPPPLRDHLRALGDRVIAVDVDDPLILEDLDFAHQTEALLRLTGSAAPAFWPPAAAPAAQTD